MYYVCILSQVCSIPSRSRSFTSIIRGLRHVHSTVLPGEPNNERLKSADAPCSFADMVYLTQSSKPRTLNSEAEMIFGHRDLLGGSITSNDLLASR